MKAQHRWHLSRCITACLGCLLVSICTACNMLSGPDTTQSITPLAIQTPSAPVTQRMPVTDISCPSGDMARPAIMKRLALGNAPSITYLSNTTNPTLALLKLYNTHTQQKTTLAQLPNEQIISAQVSADGQWLLFLASNAGILKLQLIRMDGQGLQTLYCLPSADYTYTSPNTVLAAIQWSPDQKSVLISSFANHTTSTITSLYISTGTLKSELSIVDGADSTYYYTALKWLNNRQVYITRTAFGAPASPGELYLLDLEKNHNPQGSGLKIVQHYPRRFAFSSLDSSQDGRRLFISSCLIAAKPFETSLTVGAATGGPQQLLYQQTPTACIHEMRAISSKLLLLFMEVYNGSISYDHQIWKMATDSKKYTVLSDTQANEYMMNRFTQYTWSNISRNGQLYALGPNHYASAPQQLAFGSLNGGPPTIFESASGGMLDIVGWTAM